MPEEEKKLEKNTPEIFEECVDCKEVDNVEFMYSTSAGYRCEPCAERFIFDS